VAADGIAALNDTDECSVNNGGCDLVAPCVNLVGSFYCEPCPDAYIGSSMRTLNVTSGEWTGGCITRCEDGYTAPSEQCDDANMDIGDGCDCGVEEFGYTCTLGLSEFSPSVCINLVQKIQPPRGQILSGDTTVFGMPAEDWACVDLEEDSVVHAYTAGGGYASAAFYVDEPCNSTSCPEPAPEPEVIPQRTIRDLCGTYERQCTTMAFWGDTVTYNIGQFGTVTQTEAFWYESAVLPATTCTELVGLVDPSGTVDGVSGTVATFTLTTSMEMLDTLASGETGFAQTLTSVAAIPHSIFSIQMLSAMCSCGVDWSIGISSEVPLDCAYCAIPSWELAATCTEGPRTNARTWPVDAQPPNIVNLNGDVLQGYTLAQYTGNPAAACTATSVRVYTPSPTVRYGTVMEAVNSADGSMCFSYVMVDKISGVPASAITTQKLINAGAGVDQAVSTANL
jgi:cysteine-rich repeat protein